MNLSNHIYQALEEPCWIRSKVHLLQHPVSNAGGEWGQAGGHTHTHTPSTTICHLRQLIQLASGMGPAVFLAPFFSELQPQQLCFYTCSEYCKGFACSFVCVCACVCIFPLFYRTSHIDYCHHLPDFLLAHVSSVCCRRFLAPGVPHLCWTSLFCSLLSMLKQSRGSR